MNWVPLSVMMRLATPNLTKMLQMNLTVAAAVILRTGSASGHLVNLSMATNKNLRPPGAFGKGPKMSSPQTANGHERGMV